MPAAIIAPFAASLGDRFRREMFLLALALIGTFALAASAAAAYAENEVLVFVFAAVVGLSATLFRPALQALLPSLVRSPEELIASNGATSTIESVGALVGPLLAAILVSFANVGLAFAFGAGLLLASSALLGRVRVESRLDVTSSDPDESVSEMLSGGFRTVARTPRAPLVVFLTTAQTFVRGCLNVLIVVAAFRVLDGGGAYVGYLTAAIGVGGLIGAMGAMTLGSRRLAVSFGVSLVFWGVPIVLIAPQPEFVATMILLAVVGAANSVEDVAVFTLLQRITPNDRLTRVLGLVWGLAMGGVALGSVAAPALVSALGPRAAFVLVGAILPLLTLVSYPRLVEIDKSARPSLELELVESVPMFAPLSMAAKERVASDLVPVPVSAGDFVIRAGDEGDRFYIVRDGELDIDASGRHSLAREGDYFGEIALLRNVPRTATVKANVDSRLYALRRSDFLEALTGHHAARTAGEAVADARLAASRP
jgi:MFS family permease